MKTAADRTSWRIATIGSLVAFTFALLRLPSQIDEYGIGADTVIPFLALLIFGFNSVMFWRRLRKISK